MPDKQADHSIGKADGSARIFGPANIGEICAVLPSVADEAQARRWLATVRRIDRVIVHVEGDIASCRAIGQRSRLPFSSPIRLAVGLGLGRLGVPIVVTGLAP